MLAALNGSMQLLNIWPSDGRQYLLALNLDDRRLETQFVAVRNDVDSAVAGRLRNSAVVTHALEEMRDEMLKLEGRLIVLEPLDNEILSRLFDLR